MIILDTTTRSLEVVLAGAVTTNQLPIVASFADYTTNAYVPTAAQTQTNNTTAVTAVAAPASAATRIVKLVTIYNADSANITVTLRYKSGANTRILAKPTLAAGEDYLYEGPIVLDATNKSLALILGGTVASTQADWTV